MQVDFDSLDDPEEGCFFTVLFQLFLLAWNRALAPFCFLGLCEHLLILPEHAQTLLTMTLKWRWLVSSICQEHSPLVSCSAIRQNI